MANEGKTLAIDIIARVDKLEKGMERAKKAANDNFGAIERRGKQMSDRLERDIGNAATKVTGSLTGLGKAFLGGLAGGIFAGGLEGFARGVKSTVSELATLHKVIERVGLDAKVFQELEFGFKLAGVEAGAFADGIDKFNKNIAVAATQGGKLADILKANGVAIRDSNGKIRDAQSLLRDYANLVKNAGSEAEQMLLVQEAFGRGDANFVNALKNGAKGFDDMGKAAADAGGTISKELLAKADEFDDRWDKAWRNFEINAKSSILTAITWMDRLYEKSQEIGNSGLFRGISEGMAGLGLLDSDLKIHDPALARAAGRELGPDGRIRDAFKGGAETALNDADKALIAELQKRYGGVAKKAATTIIPEKPDKPERGSRNAAAEKALREAEAVQKLIDNLSEELRLVGASDVEKAKANALRQAGAAATAEQRAEIERLVTAIYSENDALEKNREAMEELRDVSKDVMGNFISDMIEGKSAAEALADALKNIGNRLLNSGLDALFGGGSAGGAMLGSTFSLNIRSAK